MVGGIDTLREMENLPTTKDDRPKTPPKILEIIVFKNPFAEILKEREMDRIKVCSVYER